MARELHATPDDTPARNRLQDEGRVVPSRSRDQLRRDLAIMYLSALGAKRALDVRMRARLLPTAQRCHRAFKKWTGGMSRRGIGGAGREHGNQLRPFRKRLRRATAAGPG